MRNLNYLGVDYALRFDHEKTDKELLFIIDVIKKIPADGLIVEIGVRDCDFTEFMAACTAKYNPSVKIVGIDPYVDVSQSAISYERAREIIKLHPNCSLIRDYSWNAAKQFEKESIDLLIVDGDHSRQAVLKDIECYMPLVKPGGVMLFHDIYSLPSVRDALIEYFGAINPLDTKAQCRYHYYRKPV